MADFKVNQNISGTISCVKVSAHLNNGFKFLSTEGVDSLVTAKRYAEEYKNIQKLITAYATLIMKDMEDLQSMVNTVETMDNSIKYTE